MAWSIPRFTSKYQMPFDKLMALSEAEGQGLRNRGPTRRVGSLRRAQTNPEEAYMEVRRSDDG